METIADMPVAVELEGPLAVEVTAYLEIEAGWQVVSSSGPLRPQLVLAAEPRPGVVVITRDLDAERTREALLAGAIDVVAWPRDRHRLLDLPARAAPAASQRRSEPIRLGIGGTAGGVGTSTVVLAAGALLAWSGRRVLVVGGDDLLGLSGHGPWTGPGTADLARLDPRDAAGEVDRLALPVPGVTGLRVLGGGGDALGALTGWPLDIVVVDMRGDAPPEATLLVARPDSGLRRVGERPVLLNGHGVLDERQAARRFGAVVIGVLPVSARVARAGALGRVPAGLPGRWLATLRTVLRRCGR